jgi:hypothetical protein
MLKRHAGHDASMTGYYMQMRWTAKFPASVFASCVMSAVLAAQSAPPALHVLIDIKPGDTPTTIEPGRQGMIPVAILTTKEFDAADVDPTTVTMGAAGTEATVFRSMLDDVDRDGDKDRMLLFRVQEMRLKCEDSVVRLKGKTNDGRAIEGSETVKMECAK